jgi:hypothetical protein
MCALITMCNPLMDIIRDYHRAAHVITTIIEYAVYIRSNSRATIKDRR